MPDGLASLAGRAAPWLLTYLLHSTAWIAAVWLLQRTGVVRRPRTLDLVWKAALLAGFATATVVVGRAALAWSHTTSRTVDVRAVRPLSQEGGTLPAPTLAAGGPAERSRFQARLVEPSPACHRLVEERRLVMDPVGATGKAWIEAVKAACVPSRLDGHAALVLLWLAGAAGLLLLLGRDRRRIAAVLAACEPAGERVAAIAATVGGRAGAERRIVVSDAVAAPCAVSGRVALPARCEEEMDDGELAAVLAHELAHLERRDPLWLTAADLIGRLAWIQPLNRVAGAGLRDAAELMTDQRTLRHTRPLDLARSIHRVARWMVPGERPLPLVGLTRPDEGSLVRRMRRILAPGAGRSIGSAWPGAALVLGLAAGALLLPPVAMGPQLHALFIERIDGEVVAAGVIGGGNATATEGGSAALGGAAVGSGGTRVLVRVLRGGPDGRGAPTP
jgi:hypothetical protein